MSQRVGIVYAITCPDGLSYIGKTVQELGARISQHKTPHSSCRAIRDAYKKHGNKMNVRVLLRCSENDLDLNESFYIEKLDTIHPRGYNLRCGSMSAMPTTTANTLSTFVYHPIEYENDQDEQSAQLAVNTAVQEVLGTGLMPWAGVIQMSVRDLNGIRGATQYIPWAGPVKGVPIDNSGDNIPGPLPEFDDLMKTWNTWMELIQSMMQVCNATGPEYQEHAAEKMQNVVQIMEKSMKDKCIAVTAMSKHLTLKAERDEESSKEEDMFNKRKRERDEESSKEEDMFNKRKRKLEQERMQGEHKINMMRLEAEKKRLKFEDMAKKYKILIECGATSEAEDLVKKMGCM